MTKLDGTPYSSNHFRTIAMATTHIGSSTTSYETKHIIPGDAVVRYTVVPKHADNKISVRVNNSNRLSLVQFLIGVYVKFGVFPLA